jgi:c-di-AMP phosphodiesterase-like protein
MLTIGVNMKTYTNNEIQDLASSALDVACAFIQEQLNVQTGDLASLFFSGNRQEIVESIFESYIRSEIGAKNET